MLKSIRLQNFFSFQDCTINLEKGANVLVGINGSGKSNFFKAVKLLSALTGEKELTNILYNNFGGLDRIFFVGKNINTPKSFSLGVNIDNIQARETQYDITITSNAVSGYFIEREYYNEVGMTNDLIYENIERDTTQFNIALLSSGVTEKYTYAVDPNRTILNMPLENVKSQSLPLFRRIIPQIKIYDGFNTNEGSALRVSTPPSLNKSLLNDAINLASLINDIKLSDKDTYNRIIQALKSVNDKFVGIEFRLYPSGFIEMWLEEEGLNKAIPAAHMSDGTIKFLCLMAILYNPNRGPLICLDEPDLGLHPDMINTLHEAIEYAAQTSQIIISTHSAHLLDYFELSQIRVFEKDENNATVVRQYEEKEFEGWYEKFYPGQMWRAGNIGGNRW